MGTGARSPGPENGWPDEGGTGTGPGTAGKGQRGGGPGISGGGDLVLLDPVLARPPAESWEFREPWEEQGLSDGDFLSISGSLTGEGLRDPEVVDGGINVDCTVGSW